MELLFTLKVNASASIKCERVADKIYLITFTAPEDNRLRTDFCQALILALDIIELRYAPGLVVTTSSIQKFYSNGLDLNHVGATPGFLQESLYPLFKRFLLFPMPTLALINGHAYAGGFMLAMMHDYRIMNPSKGFLCLPELHMGIPFQPAMISIFREKLSALTFRKLVLEAQRYKASDALTDGILDGLGGFGEAVTFAKTIGLPGFGDTRVYGELKREMWPVTLRNLDTAVHGSGFDADAVKEREGKEKEKSVAAWEGKEGRSKL